MHISELSDLVKEQEAEISFIKADGSNRSFKCHTGAAKVFQNNVVGDKGKGASYDFKKSGVLPVWVDGQYNSDGKSGFRSVKLERVTKVTVGGTTYTVENGELIEA